MQCATRQTNLNHLAKADSLYCAIGISITILELALLTTNSKFGASSLELSFLIQIIFSVIIESSAGVLFLRWGPFVTTTYGILAKILAVFFLGSAVILSNFSNLTLTWTFLIAFFIADGIGSGCLISAFKPAYAQWFAEKMNYKEEADFLGLFKHKMLIRIGFPLAILFFSVLFFYITQSTFFLKGNYYLYSSITIIGTMLLIRLYQFKITTADFKDLNYKNREINNNAVQIQHPLIFTIFLNSLKTVKKSLLVYILGDIAYLSVMMYIIGLCFRLTSKIPMPFYLAWLGGTLIGFIIYLVSSIFGYFIYPKFSKDFSSKKIIFSVILLLISAFQCGLVFYGDIFNYQIIALIIFSLISVTVGNGLLRLVTNQIIRVVMPSYQQAVFIFAEAVASLIITLSVLVSLYSSNNNATIITLLTFILILGFATIVMLIGQPITNEIKCTNQMELAEKI